MLNHSTGQTRSNCILNKCVKFNLTLITQCCVLCNNLKLQHGAKNCIFMQKFFRNCSELETDLNLLVAVFSQFYTLFLDWISLWQNDVNQSISKPQKAKDQPILLKWKWEAATFINTVLLEGTVSLMRGERRWVKWALGCHSFGQR